jgi:hypothetical protein
MGTAGRKLAALTLAFYSAALPLRSAAPPTLDNVLVRTASARRLHAQLSAIVAEEPTSKAPSN